MPAIRAAAVVTVDPGAIGELHHALEAQDLTALSESLTLPRRASW